MNRCPVVSTPEFPAECIKQDCVGWDKQYHQCLVFSIRDSIDELGKAFDNLARSINQAVLMKPKVETYTYDPCPKCGHTMMQKEAYRFCPGCGYSDPYK